MATATTRLALRKPDTTDLINVATDLNQNFDKIDNNPGQFIGTAAARAALAGTDLWAGRQAFETDTGKQYRYNVVGAGGFWQKFPVDIYQKNRQSGSYVLNGTSWADLDNAAWDQTIPAKIGDWIEVYINAVWGAEAVDTYLNVVTVVAAAPVNSFSPGCAVTGTTGAPDNGWIAYASSVGLTTHGAFYQLVAGDIENNGVNLRIRRRTVSAANKTLYATTSGLAMSVRYINHGA